MNDAGTSQFLSLKAAAKLLSRDFCLGKLLFSVTMRRYQLIQSTIVGATRSHPTNSRALFRLHAKLLDSNLMFSLTLSHITFV
jgi:hypothetical protein